MDELDDINIDDADIVAQLRGEYTKPYEQEILDWIKGSGLEDVVFYPQDNPTILITWATPDAQDRHLFREIDIVVEDGGQFRLSGGAMYHSPTYHIAWLSLRIVAADDIASTLDGIKEQVDKLQFEDLTDMDSYLEAYMKDVLEV